MRPFALAAALAAAITGSALADGVDDSRRGQAALSEANYDLAIHFLTRAIRSGDLSLEVLAHAFYNRGIAHGEMAEYERALENYTTAIGLAPDFAAAYNNRGVIHGRKGAYESAIADYSAAIRLAPDDVTAYENRAIAYARTGAGERARADRLAAARLGEVSLEVEGRSAPDVAVASRASDALTIETEADTTAVEIVADTRTRQVGADSDTAELGADSAAAEVGADTSALRRQGDARAVEVEADTTAVAEAAPLEPVTVTELDAVERTAAPLETAADQVLSAAGPGAGTDVEVASGDSVPVTAPDVEEMVAATSAPAPDSTLGAVADEAETDTIAEPTPSASGDVSTDVEVGFGDSVPVTAADVEETVAAAAAPAPDSTLGAVADEADTDTIAEPTPGDVSAEAVGRSDEAIEPAGDDVALVGESVSAVDAAAGRGDANAVDLRDLAETYHRLGAAFAERGRFRQALEYFRVANRLAPEDATFEDTLQRLLAAPELKWAYE